MTTPVQGIYLGWASMASGFASKSVINPIIRSIIVFLSQSWHPVGHEQISGPCCWKKAAWFPRYDRWVPALASSWSTRPAVRRDRRPLRRGDRSAGEWAGWEELKDGLWGTEGCKCGLQNFEFRVVVWPETGATWSNSVSFRGGPEELVCIIWYI